MKFHMRNQSELMQSNRFINFLMETSILYYVSSCLLLFGAYLMMHSSLLNDNFIIRYIETYGLYWLYEITLAVICILVLRRLKLTDDGLILASLGILILLDPTFFNNVFYTYNLRIGLIVNSICLVLALALYFLMVFYGGVPVTRKASIAVAATALFVYGYPALLNLGLSEGLKSNYFYLLWWVPFLLLVFTHDFGISVPITWRLESVGESSLKRFMAAQIIIMEYIITSHLIESNIGYRLTFYAVYLTPLLLTGCMFVYVMKPRFHDQINGRQLVWVGAGLGAILSLGQPEVFVHKIFWGLSVTPFRVAMVAILLYFLVFLKLFKFERYRIAMLCVPFLMFLGLRTWPFAYLAVLFLILAIVGRKWPYLLVGGVASIISISTSLPALTEGLKPFLAMQAVGLWSCFLLLKNKIQKRELIVSIIAIMLLLIALQYHHIYSLTYYRLHYVALGVLLGAAGYLYKSIGLKIISAAVIATAILWNFRKAIAGMADAVQGAFSSGIIIIVLAFCALLVGYYLSVLKKRKHNAKLGKTGAQ